VSAISCFVIFARGPVKGFDEFRIYYLLRRDAFVVVRVLHGKRDIGAILEKQTIDDPDAD